MRHQDNTVSANGMAVRRCRKERGLTCGELAGMAGISERTLSRIENGRSTYPRTLGLIAKALGKTLEELLGAEALDAPHKATGPLARHICNFDAFIDDRTRGFMGRQFVFEKIGAFLADQRTPSGYLLITGDPGIGKSAIIAELIRRRRLPIYHFNTALQGICTTRQFLGNVCARIVSTFGLPFPDLPEGFDLTGALLNQLLARVARDLSRDRPLLIAIDALDEVHPHALGVAMNPLFLPPAPPDNVYFILTSRRHDDVAIQARDIKAVELVAKSRENQEDVETFTRSYLREKGTKRWMQERDLAEPDFLRMIWDRSEGNFMYLCHVLPAIARGEFVDGRVTQLPHGLRAYYRQHWAQMRDGGRDLFKRVYEPVVCTLACAHRAVSADMIATWTKLPIRDVTRALRRWKAFLHEEPAEAFGKRYLVYHKAFQEFLREEIDPGLVRYHATIADALWQEYQRQPGDTDPHATPAPPDSSSG